MSASRASWLQCLATVAVAFAHPALANPVPTLPLADAQAIAEQAMLQAHRIARDVSVVIVNREGRVILSERMDHASFLSLTLAEAKASTAAALGAPTAILEKEVDSAKFSLLSAAGVSMIAGGLPVLVAGSSIGGIGVSGGAAEEDEAVARAALASFMAGGQLNPSQHCIRRDSR